MGAQGATVMIVYSLSLLGGLALGTAAALAALFPMPGHGGPRVSSAVLLGLAVAFYAFAAYSWQRFVGGWLGLSVLVVILAICAGACLLSVVAVSGGDESLGRGLARWSRPTALVLGLLSITMLVLLVLPFVFVVPLQMR
jgi:hypothetical protein